MMAMRHSKKSPLSSKKMLELNGENAREERELEKELSRLEKERLVKIRELRTEMQNFRITSARSRSGSRSPSRSPSRRSVSPYSSSSPPRHNPGRLTETPFITQMPGYPHSFTGPVKPIPGGHAPPLVCLNRSWSHDPRDNTRLPTASRAIDQRVSRSPSPRISVSDFDSLTNRTHRSTPSPTPYSRAMSTEGCSGAQYLPTSPSLSPDASPRQSPQSAGRRMLPKRNSVQDSNPGRAASPRASLTSTTVSVLHHEGKNIKLGPRLSLCDSRDGKSPHPARPMPNSPTSAGIPQIVISSHAPNPDSPPVPPNTVRPARPRRGSSSSSNESLSGDTRNIPNAPQRRMSASLEVPVRRGRSRSVPSIPEDCTTYLRALAKKETSFETADIAEDLSLTAESSTPMRARSSSICVPYFSHLKDAPRRDSLLRKYTARRGSYRRTSCTIERLISDLARGIHHEELTSDPSHRRVNIPAEEWEKLRQCRYLRMPSKENGHGEQRMLDIDDIFS